MTDSHAVHWQLIKVIFFHCNRETDGTIETCRDRGRGGSEEGVWVRTETRGEIQTKCQNGWWDGGKIKTERPNRWRTKKKKSCKPDRKVLVHTDKTSKQKQDIDVTSISCFSRVSLSVIVDFVHCLSPLFRTTYCNFLFSWIGYKTMYYLKYIVFTV